MFLFALDARDRLLSLALYQKFTRNVCVSNQSYRKNAYPHVSVAGAGAFECFSLLLLQFSFIYEFGPHDRSRISIIVNIITTRLDVTDIERASMCGNTVHIHLKINRLIIRNN